MKSAAFSKQSWMSGRYAVPMDRSGTFKPADLAETGKPNAADNLFVTTEDYAKFVISVVNQEGLTPAVATERQRRQVDIPAPAACKQNRIKRRLRAARMSPSSVSDGSRIDLATAPFCPTAAMIGENLRWFTSCLRHAMA